MKATLTSIVFLILILVFGTSCNKDDTGGPDTNSNQKISVQGKVTDENDSPVAGATVKSGDVTGTTNSSGEFNLQNVSASDRVVVSVSATGFFEAFRGFSPTDDQNAYVNVMIVSKGQPVTFNAASGGNLTHQGGSVQIAPNTVADANGNAYTGMVSAYVKFHNPSQPNFSRIMQGGDFAGVNAAAQTGVLTSYGFYSVELEGAGGAKLNLKQGSKADFSMPITPAQSSTSPATVKLWWFDKSAGIWKEEGTATKTGNVYTGQVSHFSEWNCDDWGTVATIKGKVVCNGNAVANSEVVITNGANKLSTFTGSKGDFSIKIPAGFQVTVTVAGMGPVPVGPLTTGQVHDMGTLDKCAGPPMGQGTYSIGSFSASAMVMGIDITGGTMYKYTITGISSANNSTVILYLGANPVSSRTYSVVDFATVQNLAPGQAYILAQDYRDPNNSSAFHSTGGGQISVTVTGSQKSAVFTNIPMENTSNQTPTTVSGNFSF